LPVKVIDAKQLVYADWWWFCSQWWGVWFRPRCMNLESDQASVKAGFAEPQVLAE